MRRIVLLSFLVCASIAGTPSAQDRRHAQPFRSFTVLVADYAENRVLLLDRDGELAREIKGVLGAADAEILPDGGWLCAESQRGRVVEFGPDGSVRWSYVGAKSPRRAQRLRNGHTLVCDPEG